MTQVLIIDKPQLLNIRISLIIPVDLARRRKPVAVRSDKSSFPQAAEGLVARDFGVVVKIREEFPEIVGAFVIGSTPEPELLHPRNERVSLKFDFSIITETEWGPTNLANAKR